MKNMVWFGTLVAFFIIARGSSRRAMAIADIFRAGVHRPCPIEFHGPCEKADVAMTEARRQ